LTFSTGSGVILKVVRQESMKVLSVAGDRVAILLDGAATNQQYTIMEACLPPNAGPPPHVHHREDETISVLSGEITFFLGDTTRVLKKGDFIFAPRGIPHHFKNTGEEEAILLETASPAGIEVFFEAAGHVLPDREASPLPRTAEDIAHMIEVAPSFGIDILVH
jgi:quercetin dioxygenase-like cupin family protein